MGVSEMQRIADWMDRVIRQPTDEVCEKVLGEVLEVTARFPAPGISR
jgi:glycine/serine hydroxymethyltransferase